MDDTNKVGCQEVVRTAVSHDGMVLVFAPEEMRDNVTLACNVNPGGVGAKKTSKDASDAIFAFLMPLFSPKLPKEEVVQAAASQNGLALEYASPRSPGITPPKSMSSTSNLFESDPDCENSCPSLSTPPLLWNHQRLREKTETVLAALGQNPDAIQHVMPSVRPMSVILAMLNSVVIH